MFWMVNFHPVPNKSDPDSVLGLVVPKDRCEAIMDIIKTLYFDLNDVLLKISRPNGRFP